MDGAFRELAISEPDRLVEALDPLVARNPIDRVVRFLNEDATLGDEVHPLRSPPTKPFLRAAW
jgi:hypothetical protein